jgi:hypothetical protein
MPTMKRTTPQPTCHFGFIENLKGELKKIDGLSNDNEIV